MDYRRKCFERKGQTCQVCGDDDDIVVHHIDGDRRNDSIENLLPVCRSCHSKIHQGVLSEWSGRILDPIERERTMQLKLSPEENRDISVLKQLTGAEKDIEVVRQAIDYFATDLSKKSDELDYMIEMKRLTGLPLSEVTLFTYKAFGDVVDALQELLTDPDVSDDVKRDLVERLDSPHLRSWYDVDVGLEVET